MQAMRSVVVSDEQAVQAMPGPPPRPPGRPPAEPIVIRTPPRRPRDDLEIERSDDEEDGGEIRRPPDSVPTSAAATARGTRGASHCGRQALQRLVHGVGVGESVAVSQSPCSLLGASSHRSAAA